MRWIFLINLARLSIKAGELGVDFIIFTFYRSSEEQLAEFNAGRSRTKEGLHPKWLAVDLALWGDVDKDGVVDRAELHWDFRPAYTTLGQYWESLGGVWGGRWKDPCDPYHFEWGAGLKL